MFKRTFEKLNGEISGEIAFNHVAEISRHHRIQASPGLRAAVEYASDTLRGYGLNVDVRRYKADGKTLAWSSLMFKEWSCSDAELMLVEPVGDTRYLARFSENKMSIIQRSFSTPRNGIEAEVIILQKGEEESEYSGLDLNGKVVLTNGDVARVRELAVEKHGAIGILYDGMWVREPSLREGELDDALKYTSFWWYGAEKPCWGFVLSPRAGKWLRRIIEGSERPIKVHARVDSKLYEGEMENCIATIPGKTKEMVVIVAHICHPQPSANDNASGSGAAMEAARALQRLVASGWLSKPRRSIVFTLVPEISGTYPWLMENETLIPEMVAALNLDMVGENQNLCGGSLIMERTPESCSSYVNSLIEAVYDSVKAEAKNLGGSASYALFKHAVTPFSGGSDHYIYSDPTVGVPCPMIIQWPDKFWHTSADTIDKVDPEMLRKVALITATYAYFLADAGPEEALWLTGETASREKRALLKRVQDMVTETSEGDAEKASQILSRLRERIEYNTSRSIEAVASVKRLAPKEKTFDDAIASFSKDLELTMKSELKRAETLISQIVLVKGWTLKPPRKRPTKLEREAKDIVPVRKFRGPVSTREWMRKLSPMEREAFYRLGKAHKETSGIETLAVYWSNGTRSLLDVSRLVELESGRTDLEYLVDYFRFLEKMGLIELR